MVGSAPVAQHGAEGAGPAGGLPPEVLASIVERVLEGVAVVDEVGQCRYVNAHGLVLLGATDEREAAAWVTEASTEPAGWSRWPNLEPREVELDPVTRQRVITFRDVSAVRAGQRRFEALSYAVASITESGSLADALSAVAFEVKETLHLAAVNIVMLGAAADRPLHILGGAGFSGTLEERASRMRRAEALGAEFKYREAMATGHLVVIPHRRERVLRDPRWAPSHATLSAVEWDGFVSAPLLARGRVVGTLSAFYPPDVEADQADLGLFAAMAKQAAVAVDNVGLLAQTQRRAATQERNRLARELHDSIVQDVFSLAVHARTIQVSAEVGGPLADERIRRGAADLLDLSRSALTSLKALIFELRPPALQDHSVVDAVRAYAATMTGRSGVPIDVVDERDDTVLSDAAGEDVYRVVQEALHNVVRHAQAGHVVVRFWTGDDDGPELVVSIEDDGVGFDPAGVREGHLGLVTMQERAEVLGGTLQVCSRPGAGTTVMLRAPRPSSAPTIGTSENQP
jgi:signal transduction histidine kinase